MARPVSAAAARPGVLARGLMLLVKGYRKGISPLLPPSCRFYPSCSEYALEALRVHGAARGTLLAVRRLLRCGPWHPGGIDPVPPRRGAGTSALEDLTEHPAKE
ncbi:membrane protein insertion efficiency factor YidD [Sciscionella sediminilitoris]|uniref:membrane protein insertion efficiency factor YidD n=1 Tax=Sciscionella sediminilitoris TaxID=1445613 RepID=UPI0009EB8A81|nr:membrane protein insertion efficiency factor YidD [Sciscionella sp. SE31]